ncbi:hypothetical protein C8Q70DRAFT_934752 [Cubamyces menziesii]|nr:hypothetical protein C8Q70DRAFT_934752 [Cubamyces menziesii]
MPIICAHNAQAASPREEGQVAEGPYCYEYAEDDGDDTDGATVYSEAHHWQYSATKTVEDAASPGPSGWLESVPPSVSYHPDVPHNHSVNHPASVDTGYYAGGPFPFTGHPEVIEAHWREPLHSQMPSPSAYSPRTYDVSEFNPEGY